MGPSCTILMQISDAPVFGGIGTWVWLCSCPESTVTLASSWGLGSLQPPFWDWFCSGEGSWVDRALGRNTSPFARDYPSYPALVNLRECLGLVGGKSLALHLSQCNQVPFPILTFMSPSKIQSAFPLCFRWAFCASSIGSASLFSSHPRRMWGPFANLFTQHAHLRYMSFNLCVIYLALFFQPTSMCCAPVTPYRRIEVKLGAVVEHLFWSWEKESFHSRRCWRGQARGPIAGMCRGFSVLWEQREPACVLSWVLLPYVDQRRYLCLI